MLPTQTVWRYLPQHDQNNVWWNIGLRLDISLITTIIPNSNLYKLKSSMKVLTHEVLHLRRVHEVKTLLVNHQFDFVGSHFGSLLLLPLLDNGGRMNNYEIWKCIGCFENFYQAYIIENTDRGLIWSAVSPRQYQSRAVAKCRPKTNTARLILWTISIRGLYWIISPNFL